MTDKNRLLDEITIAVDHWDSLSTLDPSFQTPLGDDVNMADVSTMIRDELLRILEAAEV